MGFKSEYEGKTWAKISVPDKEVTKLQVKYPTFPPFPLVLR